MLEKAAELKRFRYSPLDKAFENKLLLKDRLRLSIRKKTKEINSEKQ